MRFIGLDQIDLFFLIIDEKVVVTTQTLEWLTARRRAHKGYGFALCYNRFCLKFVDVLFVVWHYGNLDIVEKSLFNALTERIFEGNSYKAKERKVASPMVL